jgi:hypothetical protein
MTLKKLFLTFVSILSVVNIILAVYKILDYGTIQIDQKNNFAAFMRITV